MGMLLADGNGITGGDGVRVLINTPLDGRPGDLTWQITQPEGLVIDSGAGVTNKMVILPDGDYNFTIFHSTDNGKADYTLSDKKRMPLREGAVSTSVLARRPRSTSTTAASSRQVPTPSITWASSDPWAADV